MSEEAEATSSNTQSEKGSGVATVLKPIFFITDLFSLVTKPIVATGSFMGEQWANHVNHEGIPKTSRIVMDAMQERYIEAGVAEMRRLQADPDFAKKLIDGGFVQNMGENLMIGLADDSATAALLAKEPTIGLPLSTIRAGINGYSNQVEFYRDFVKIAGSINPETLRPNIVGFASVPFTYNEAGKEGKEYTVLIDAGHTLGEFIAEEGHENRPVYLIVDEDGNAAPRHVRDSLAQNKDFRERVLEPALYDAYAQMRDTFGFNMVDGKLDKAEYGLYIKDVLKNSKIMDEIAMQGVQTLFRKELLPELYTDEPSRNLNDYNKATITAASTQKP